MTESNRNAITYYTHRLGNGLQIVAQPMPDFESVSTSFYVRTGARDELDASISGVSHFLEHMMFKGTQTLDWQQITQEFNRIGAELNAFTSLEATVYYARVLGEKLDRAFELLSDMMHPRLAESDFEMEKEVIINEIARSEESPYGLAYRRMLHTYFDTHPLGNYVLGSRESIRDLHIEQMRNYWQRRYGANNMILAVAGNFDWAHLLELAEQRCSEWRVGDTARQLSPYEPTSLKHNVVVDEKLKQQIMFVTMPGISVEDPDYYAAALGASILGGDGSRMFWNIRHKGLAISSSSFINALQGAGIVVLQGNATPEKAPQVLKMLRDELNTFLDEGATEDELRRVKDKWTSSIILRAESTFARMRSLAADWVHEGRLIDLDEEIERVERITVEDVMRVWRRLPLRDKQLISTLGPLSESELLV